MHHSGRNPSKKNVEKYWPLGATSLLFDDYLNACKLEKPTSEEELMRAFCILGSFNIYY